MVDVIPYPTHDDMRLMVKALAVTKTLSVNKTLSVPLKGGG